jgi:hypothetical protein
MRCASGGGGLRLIEVYRLEFTRPDDGPEPLYEGRGAVLVPGGSEDGVDPLNLVSSVRERCCGKLDTWVAVMVDVLDMLVCCYAGLNAFMGGQCLILCSFLAMSGAVKHRRVATEYALYTVRIHRHLTRRPASSTPISPTKDVFFLLLLGWPASAPAASHRTRPSPVAYTRSPSAIEKGSGPFGPRRVFRHDAPASLPEHVTAAMRPHHPTSLAACDALAHLRACRGIRLKGCRPRDPPEPRYSAQMPLWSGRASTRVTKAREPAGVAGKSETLSDTNACSPSSCCTGAARRLAGCGEGKDKWSDPACRDAAVWEQENRAWPLYLLTASAARNPRPAVINVKLPVRA